jgi:hypothetical protein
MQNSNPNQAILNRLSMIELELKHQKKAVEQIAAFLNSFMTSGFDDDLPLPKDKIKIK